MTRPCVDGDVFEVDETTGVLTLKTCVTGLLGQEVFSSPGAFNFDMSAYPRACRVRVRMVGGGGGSAGVDADAGEVVVSAGGSGGGYSESVILASTVGAFATVIVGAGGAAGAPGGDGQDGAASQFGILVTAPGGLGSANTMVSGTAPATANGVSGLFAGQGDIAMGGGASGTAIRLSGTAGVAGAGGDSYLGTGGLGRGTPGGGFGGKGYGAGGGGAVSTGNPFSGAAGNSGIVIVEVYG